MDEKFQYPRPFLKDSNGNRYSKAHAFGEYTIKIFTEFPREISYQWFEWFKSDPLKNSLVADETINDYLGITEEEHTCFVIYCDSVSWDGNEAARDNSGEGTREQPFKNLNRALEIIKCYRDHRSVGMRCYKDRWVIKLTGVVDYVIFLAGRRGDPYTMDHVYVDGLQSDGSRIKIYPKGCCAGVDFLNCDIEVTGAYTSEVIDDRKEYCHGKFSARSLQNCVLTGKSLIASLVTLYKSNVIGGSEGIPGPKFVDGGSYTDSISVYGISGFDHVIDSNVVCHGISPVYVINSNIETRIDCSNFLLLLGSSMLVSEYRYGYTEKRVFVRSSYEIHQDIHKLLPEMGGWVEYPHAFYSVYNSKIHISTDAGDYANPVYISWIEQSDIYIDMTAGDYSQWFSPSQIALYLCFNSNINITSSSLIPVMIEKWENNTVNVTLNTSIYEIFRVSEAVRSTDIRMTCKGDVSYFCEGIFLLHEGFEAFENNTLYVDDITPEVSFRSIVPVWVYAYSATSPKLINFDFQYSIHNVAWSKTGSISLALYGCHGDCNLPPKYVYTIPQKRPEVFDLRIKEFKYFGYYSECGSVGYYLYESERARTISNYDGRLEHYSFVDLKTGETEERTYSICD
jgi:hypothetical protein